MQFDLYEAFKTDPFCIDPFPCNGEILRGGVGTSYTALSVNSNQNWLQSGPESDVS